MTLSRRFTRCSCSPLGNACSHERTAFDSAARSAAIRGDGAKRLGRVSVLDLRRLAARLPARTDQKAALRELLLPLLAAVARESRVLHALLSSGRAACGVPPVAFFDAAGWAPFDRTCVLRVKLADLAPAALPRDAVAIMPVVEWVRLTARLLD